MGFLIAGLVGAIVASIFSVFYNFFSRQLEGRANLTVDVVSWSDDVYDRLITIHAQREATFTGAQFGLSNEEYRTIVKEVKSMLLASKMHAKVRLIYGEGRELGRFDALRDEFISVTELLLQATKENWEETNKEVNNRFSRVIEPMMRSTEEDFVRGAKPSLLTYGMPKVAKPVIYLPKKEEGVASSIKSDERALSMFRPVILIGIILLTVWVLSGRPDILSHLKGIAGGQAKMSGQNLTGLYVQSSSEYGLDAESEEAPISSGMVLNLNKQEFPLRLAIKNYEDVALQDIVFMIFIPSNIATINEKAWKNSWQEIPTRSGRWLSYNFKEDIKPKETFILNPPVEVKAPAGSTYIVQYKYFCDNLHENSGYIVLKTSGDNAK